MEDKRDKNLSSERLREDRAKELDRMGSKTDQGNKGVSESFRERGRAPEPGIWEARGLITSVPPKVQLDFSKLDQADVARVKDEVGRIRTQVNINADTWGRGFRADREKDLQQLENVFADVQGRRAVNVQIWEAKLSDYPSKEKRDEAISANGWWRGRYSGDKIVINGEVARSGADPDKWAAISALAHESRHAFQDAVMMEFRMAEGKKPDMVRGVSALKIQSWIYAGRPPHPLIDPVAYSNHPLEVDARAYEAEVMKQLKKEEL